MEKAPIRMAKAVIGGKFYDVVDYEEYQQHSELYGSMNAVDISRPDGTNIILPCRSGNPDDGKPGIYRLGDTGVHLMVYPDDEESFKPTDYTSFDDVESVKEYSQKCQKVHNMERESLMCIDPSKHYRPPISGRETPVMKGLKDAIIAKGIDLDQYSGRFGDNYPNDKRKLNEDSITLFMFERFCKNLDLNARMVIEDISGNPANPIGYPISIDLFSSDDENE